MMMQFGPMLFGTINGVALLAFAAMPVVVMAAVALANRRTAAGVSPEWAWRTSLTEVGLAYATVPWVWLTLQPGSDAGNVPGRLSLIPLQDLATMGLGGIVGNLLLFAVLGVLVPMRFAMLASVPRVLALAAGCSIMIEATQYVLQLDRVTSVDDVLLNTAGAGLAALLSRRWWLARTPTAVETHVEL